MAEFKHFHDLSRSGPNNNEEADLFARGLGQSMDSQPLFDINTLKNEILTDGMLVSATGFSKSYNIILLASAGMHACRCNTFYSGLQPIRVYLHTHAHRLTCRAKRIGLWTDIRGYNIGICNLILTYPGPLPPTQHNMI